MRSERGMRDPPWVERLIDLVLPHALSPNLEFREEKSDESSCKLRNASQSEKPKLRKLEFSSYQNNMLCSEAYIWKLSAPKGMQKAHFNAISCAFSIADANLCTFATPPSSHLPALSALIDTNNPP